MKRRSNWFRVLPVVFWIVALVAALLVAQGWDSATGWDLQVYVNAIHSLQAGHDPYADGIAAQRAAHMQRLIHPDSSAVGPFTYPYSPLTLPLLRLSGSWPMHVTAMGYWLLYSAGVLAIALAGLQAAEPGERRVFALLAPAAVFYPGLLLTMVFLSGNVAYILYGLVFATALLGWHRDRWGWFYAATLLASCCKAPMLSLLAIAPLSARRQWLPTCLAGAAGVGLFALQPVLWPSAFHNYMQAVQLQFAYNDDFGVSPAGWLGKFLFFRGIPYSLPTSVFYAVYAALIFATLLYLSRRFFDRDFSLQQWIPVLLVGVLLLNPRIKEYDAAALSIPMALVAWRLFARGNTFGRTMLEFSFFFLAANAVATNSGSSWQAAEGVLLVALFAAGCWNLLHPTASMTTSSASRIEENRQADSSVPLLR